MIGIIVSGGLSFLFVLISTYLGVNYFKSRNIGQNIQEEVIHHEHKKGTPTMGWNILDYWYFIWIFCLTY